ncbi:MAG: MFS transporter [bacterium]
MGGNRALWLLWAGEFASRIGESFFQITLLWYLVESLGSNLEVGLITMIGYLPALVVGMWAGVFVDRLDYRQVMLGANLLRAGAVVSIPLLYALGYLPPMLVAALAFLVTSCSAFFNPARDAVIPLLARGGQLLRANSLVQSAWQFSLLIGPFLAALALPFMPTVYLFLLVGLAFLGSWAVLLALRGGERDATAVAPGAEAGERPLARLLREMREGFGYLREERRVFWIWVITAVNNFFLMGPVIVGMPIYVKEHLGASGSAFALIEGAYAGGMILSTWLIVRYGGRWNPTRMLFVGLIYDGLTFVPMLWLSSVTGTAILIVIHSLGIPTITISRLTALHGMVRPEVRGRIFSYFHLAVSGMTALSIGTVGVVLNWIAIHELFAVIGVLCAACGVWGLALPHFRGTALSR